jgi:hypothetical protein
MGDVVLIVDQFTHVPGGPGRLARDPDPLASWPSASLLRAAFKCEPALATAGACPAVGSVREHWSMTSRLAAALLRDAQKPDVPTTDGPGARTSHLPVVRLFHEPTSQPWSSSKFQS